MKVKIGRFDLITVESREGKYKYYKVFRGYYRKLDFVILGSYGSCDIYLKVVLHSSEQLKARIK